MDILLAIIGVVLTILLSGPVIALSKRVIALERRRRWSGKQYRRGNIYDLRHFAFEEWALEMRVEDNGSTTQEFNARIVNLSRTTLDTFYMPLFSDGSNISGSVIRPWAKFGRRNLPVRLDSWDEIRAEGRVAIQHVPPLKPGERRRIRWGFTLPSVFEPGNEYYVWDVEVPYYDMAGKLEFSRAWKLLYARWEIEDGRYYDPPTIEGSTIKWKIKFPEPRTRLHMKLGLAHT